jgi:SAM-dependent methyltransferase
MNCRHCATPLHAREHLFIDLGSAPPSNAFLREQDLDAAEAHWPLKAYVCPCCLLVQLDEVQRHDVLFSDDYVYFSSYSRSWLEHARGYVDEACARLDLTQRSRVLEVASNDGYLLQYFAQRGIGCVGVEPTAGTAAAARERGIDTIGEFFGDAFAQRFVAARGRMDLVLGNNVLAHVPDINDFVAGLREVLAPRGTLTLEFPHLLQLVQQAQFDTIYHEHFSYLSLHTVQRLLAAHGLVPWDVQVLPTHGGSLRVWAQHAGHARAPTPAVAHQLGHEVEAGLLGAGFYRGLQQRAEGIKHSLLRFLLDCKRDGRGVAAYGAAAKGNTLLNFAGVRADLLPYVVDASPHKQGRFLPGSRIPVLAEAQLRRTQPRYIVILPWNLRDEISAQLAYAREWGAQFVTAVPRLAID